MTLIARSDPHLARPQRNDPQATVEDLMTRAPLTLAATDTAARAFAVMRTLRCHHVPVMQQGRLIGIVSPRDLLRLECRADAEESLDEVRAVMSPRLLTTDPSAKVRDVAREMAAGDVDAAVVVSDGYVVGILTVTDVLAYLHASPRESS